MFKKASESIEGKAETWLAAKASNTTEASIFTKWALYAQEEDCIAEEEAGRRMCCRRSRKKDLLQKKKSEEEFVAEEAALAVSRKGIQTFMLKSFVLAHTEFRRQRKSKCVHLRLALLVGDLRVEKFRLKRMREISGLNPVQDH